MKFASPSVCDIISKRRLCARPHWVASDGSSGVRHSSSAAAVTSRSRAGLERPSPRVTSVLWQSNPLCRRSNANGSRRTHNQIGTRSLSRALIRISLATAPTPVVSPRTPGPIRINGVAGQRGPQPPGRNQEILGEPGRTAPRQSAIVTAHSRGTRLNPNSYFRNRHTPVSMPALHRLCPKPARRPGRSKAAIAGPMAGIRNSGPHPLQITRREPAGADLPANPKR